MSARFHARDQKVAVAKAAAYTGLPPRTIKYLADAGRLPYTTLGGTARPRRWFALSDLDRLLVEHRGKSA